MVSIAVVVTVIATLVWQGSTPGDEIRMMRAEVVRRLGHATVADCISRPISPETVSNPE